MTQRWLSMSEAEEYSGMCRTTLLRLLREGILQGSKTLGKSGHWRIDKESIDAHLTPDVNQKAIDIIRSLRL